MPADPEDLPGSMLAMLWQALLGLLEAARAVLGRRWRDEPPCPFCQAWEDPGDGSDGLPGGGG